MKRTILMVVVLLTILLCGCSLHFKATDVELDSVGSLTYELDYVALLRPTTEERLGEQIDGGK